MIWFRCREAGRPKRAPESRPSLEQQRSWQAPRVRCPRCGWIPDGKPHWECEECGCRFDTFETRAHCPQCPNSWTFTQCIACDELSPHEQWYVDNHGPEPSN